jgi:hypothetical protein
VAVVFLDDHEDDETTTGATFGYFALWLAGFFLPLEVARWMWLFEVGTTGRLGAVVAAVVVLDTPLIRAGVAGRGPRPIVQPWSWGHYAFWLGGRSFLFAIAVF